MSAALDTASRLEIDTLFALYCHRVDHADADGWAALFTPGGSFEVEGAFRLDGREQLRGMPAIVTEQGGGKWRHQITNIVAEPGEEPETARVIAYGIVSDWRDGGKLVTFSDYEIVLRRVEGAWRIATLLARTA